MGYINHTKADSAPFYTYEQYLKDKKAGVKKDSFAYAYWEHTDYFIDHGMQLNLRAKLDDFYSSKLCRTVNWDFSSMRESQEYAAQKYLIDHNLEIDQWPDPYLPIMWRPAEHYNPQYPKWKLTYFKDPDDGFVFNYFANEYTFGGNCKYGTTLQFDQPSGLEVPWLASIGILTADKKTRKQQLDNMPNNKLKKYQEKFLSIPEYIDCLKADRNLRQVKKEMKPHQKEIENIPTIWNKLAWILIGIVGIFCLSLMLLSACWYFTGQSSKDVQQWLVSNFGTESHLSVLLVWLLIGFFVYSILSFGVQLGGTVGFLIGEGILLLLLGVLLLFLGDRLKAKEFPFGKKVREAKKKAAYWKKQLKEAQKEVEQAEQAYEKAKEKIMATAGYQEAEQLQTWWFKNSHKLAPEWHDAWYECCLKRSHFEKMSDPAIRKTYQKRILERPL